MGAGYANARPPIHPLVIERVLARLNPPRRFTRALDVGCGAGLSTRPLIAIAERCLAIDPAEAMLSWGASAASGGSLGETRMFTGPLMPVTSASTTSNGQSIG